MSADPSRSTHHTVSSTLSGSTADVAIIAKINAPAQWPVGSGDAEAAASASANAGKMGLTQVLGAGPTFAVPRLPSGKVVPDVSVMADLLSSSPRRQPPPHPTAAPPDADNPASDYRKQVRTCAGTLRRPGGGAARYDSPAQRTSACLLACFGWARCRCRKSSR